MQEQESNSRQHYYFILRFST